MSKVNLADKLTLVQEHWSPKTVGEMNDYELKVVKVQGEFTWHLHDETDEFFLVIEGRLTIRLRDREVVLEPGELFVVRKGVEHCPVQRGRDADPAHRAKGCVNTGDAGGHLTATAERI